MTGTAAGAEGQTNPPDSLFSAFGGGLLAGPEDAFLRDVEAIRGTLRPGDPIEGLLVDRCIQAAWRLRKIALAEAQGPLDAAALGVEASAERSLLGSLEALERRQGRRLASFGRPGLQPSPPAASPGDGACAPSASDFGRGWVDGEPGSEDRRDPVAWRGRLIFDVNVSNDSPVVRGTWVTVNHIISLIVDGWSWAELLRTHPELTEDDLRACLAYHVQEEAGDPPLLG